jgi:hypothetical protein
VGRLKASHNLAASLGPLRRMVVVSCMIGVEVDSGSGSIGSEGESCMMNELFR